MEPSGNGWERKGSSDGRRYLITIESLQITPKAEKGTYEALCQQHKGKLKPISMRSFSETYFTSGNFAQFGSKKTTQ